MTHYQLAFFTQLYIDSQITLPDMSPANLPVPEVLRQHAEDEIQFWIRTRFDAMEANGQKELAIRPFCRWLDRNMEAIFTEGKSVWLGTWPIFYYSNDPMRGRFRPFVGPSAMLIE